MMLLTHCTNAYSVALARTLNGHNFNYLVLADRRPDQIYSDDLRYQQRLSHEALPVWIDEYQPELEFMFLLSADDDALFRMLWEHGVRYQIPFVFRTTDSRTDWIAHQNERPFFWAGLAWTESTQSASSPPLAFRRSVPEQPVVDASSEDYITVSSATVATVSYHLIHHRTHAGFYALNNLSTYVSKDRINTHS